MTLSNSRPDEPRYIGLYSYMKGWQGPTREALDMVERWALEYSDWMKKYSDFGAGDTACQENLVEYIRWRLYSANIRDYDEDAS